MKLDKSIEKYFMWINTLPKESNLKKYHPLKNMQKLVKIW